MHGLFGTYGQTVQWDLSQYEHLLHRNIVFDSIAIEQRTLNKFVDDKPFIETPTCIYALEGVLFGPSTNLAELYEEYGETFMRVLRGSFSGFLYDKQKDTLLMFTDHIGSKMLFFYQDKEGVVFAPDWSILARALQGRNTSQLDETFAWSMLTYGYSPDLRSPLKGIQRLGAGECLIIHKNELVVKSYYHFNNTCQPITMSDAVVRLDHLFRQAVQRVLSKNQQYGLKHYCSLSAGLDSRMSVAVARDLTQDLLTTITYSESGYYDETIPKEIAQQWKCQSFFRALDGGDYLGAIDSISHQTQGLVNYSGAAQVCYGWQDVIKEQCGVVLTGMLGDIVIQSRYKKDISVSPGIAAISQRWLGSLPDLYNERYPNQELYYLYVRGFNCANLGQPLVTQHYSESYSPFYDVDVLSFCLSLPKSLRYAYQLYDAWIKQCYPQAATWLHNGVRPIGYYPKQITLFHRPIAIKDVPKRTFWFLCKHLHIHDYYKQQQGQSMNPEDDWLESNPELMHTLCQYYHQHRGILHLYPALAKAAEDLFEQGVAMEKFNVLSLLAALQLH